MKWMLQSASWSHAAPNRLSWARGYAIASAVILVIGAIATNPATAGNDDSPMSLCLPSGLAAAVAAGGEYRFDCDPVILLGETLTVRGNVTLDGTGHNVVLSGGEAVRLFTVEPGGHLTLIQVTLTHGRSTNGGAIYNLGRLDLIGCTIVSNTAAGLPLRPTSKGTALMRAARAELVRLIPPDEPFILVDEEQLRPTLPHRHAQPFLEKDGIYWGPPDDDVTAVNELRRMREAGARQVAFIWSTFWWLDHYPGLKAYLENDWPPAHRSDAVCVYGIQPPADAQA